MEYKGETLTPAIDGIAGKLRTWTHYVVIVAFGYLPLVFIPNSAVPLGFTKTFFVIIGVSIALILSGLLLLRTNKISFGFPKFLYGLWGVFLVTLIGAALSGDFKDAFVGDSFSIHSAAFVGVLALIATLWVIIDIDKAAVMKMYLFFAISTIVLVVFHLLRLFLGGGALSLGALTNSTSTLVGGWNDLAIFLGLSILLALVALEHLPLTKGGRWLFAAVTVASLIMLGVINFVYVWVVLAIASFVIVVYTLRKPGSTGDGEFSLKKTATSSLALALPVFAVSLLFIVAGSWLGNHLNNITGISYVEVRPSVEATVGIGKQVYESNALLGSGPNKFIDAWRLHKDAAINPTIFWNTDFNAGNGYITTFFVTTGVLGIALWIAFLALFLMAGFRMVFRSPQGDNMWYFIGVSAFVSAAYVWGMSLIYVPGSTILLIGAVCTGVMALAYNAIFKEGIRTFSVQSDKRTGFIFTLVVLVVIIGSVALVFASGKHYASVYTFTNAVASIVPGSNIDDIERRILEAHALSENDVYKRRLAEFQLARMASLMQLAAPSPDEQQQFRTALEQGILHAVEATELDGTDAANWGVLGSIYSVLVTAAVEGAYDRASESLTRASQLDPVNPGRKLALAELEARNNNLGSSRLLAEEAVILKPNYTDAFFFLTQLAIAEGDVIRAIETAEAVALNLEPQNPARFYQLGVLYSTNGDIEKAVAAFERAVGLDPNYANAMYFLALGYDALNRPEDALVQLRKVLALNPGNPNVTDLISQLETNGTLNVATTPNVPPIPSEDAAVVTTENGAVTTTEDPDSSLITPVNIVPEDGSEAEEEEDDTDEETVSAPETEPEGDDQSE